MPSIFQMGMMKEHVRGPIKCCETIAADVLIKTRAEELVFNPEFKSVGMDINLRQMQDSHGGSSPARFIGKPVVKTHKDVLDRLLMDILEKEEGGGWEKDYYGHVDLIIEEYMKVSIGSNKYFTVDWNREDNKAKTNYFLYYTMNRIDHDVSNRDLGEPEEPSMADLESLVTPPRGLHERHDGLLLP